MRSILLRGWVFVGMFTAAGCSEVLGIEDWQDPPNLTGGGEGGAGGTDNGDGGTGEGGETAAPDAGICENGVQDGDETGVDCGGGSCLPCPDRYGCVVDKDCQSGYCPPTRGYCLLDDGRAACGMEDPENATCGDCVKNGGETDVDCGGDACGPCRSSKSCQSDADCMSARCSEGACLPGTRGLPCFANADCESQACGTLGCPAGSTCCQ